MSILNKIMGVQEASEIWGLSPERIKHLCADGTLEARKIGNTWIMVKEQPNPRGGIKMLSNELLDNIVAHRPHLKQLVDNIRASKGRIRQQAERQLADIYTQGVSELTPSETLELASLLRK